MATYTDVLISSEWTDVFSGAGFTAGAETVVFQNKGFSKIVISFSSDEPSDNKQGLSLDASEKIVIPPSCEGLWAKTTENGLTNLVVLESDSNFNLNSSIPADVFTANNLSGVRRIAVDSQQTSYEQNTEFKYFDTFSDVTDSEQIVYKVISTNPIDLYARVLSLYEGGREYLVYADSSNISFSGTLANSGAISPVNNNLNSHITVHPTTGMTIQRAIGESIFSFVDTENPDTPTDGIITLVSSANKGASSELSSEGNRLGYAAGTFWLVMNPLSTTTDNSSGLFKLKWAELFETLY